MFKTLISRSCLLILFCCSFAVTAAEQRVLVYGDSLSAGFGIAVRQSWPALLERRLKETGANTTVTNASISGETTAAGACVLPPH